MRITLIVLSAICLIFSPSDARVRGYANQGRVAVGNRSVNQNVNVNRNANVNRNVNVNNNVNVNRNVNVNVHDGYYGGGCCYYHDDPNWGSFAMRAAWVWLRLQRWLQQPRTHQQPRSLFKLRRSERL
jgi:hypothetical protein